MRSPLSPASSSNAFAPKSILEGIILLGVMLLVWPLQDAIESWRPYRRNTE